MRDEPLSDADIAMARMYREWVSEKAEANAVVRSMFCESGPSGQADTKADTSQNSEKISLPDSPELLRLCKEIKKRPKGVKILDVCRDFTDGDEAKAKNLARQARRYPHLTD